MTPRTSDTSTSTPHLSAVGLAKSYRKGRSEVSVLAGVDLDAERGEMLAVIGSSGSGKSTLLQLLGLLDAPDGGEVRLHGERIDDRPNRHRDRLRNQTFGFIFQAYHLLPELSARENVMLPGLIRHGVLGYLKQRRLLRRDADELLDRVGLGHRKTHRPAELSGGEMQRAAIARALAGHPEILLADEPTGNLDAETGAEVFALLHGLNRERGLTMLVVTHDLQIARKADRVVHLRGGSLQPWEDRAGHGAAAGHAPIPGSDGNLDPSEPGPAGRPRLVTDTGIDHDQPVYVAAAG